ncbi:sigma factor [Nitrobacter winogradskyi]
MPWDFHTLFMRHSKEIANALRRRGVSPENAADLTQEAFLRLLTAGRPDQTHAIIPAPFFSAPLAICISIRSGASDARRKLP